MKILYFAPDIFPSQRANSNHVFSQVYAMAIEKPQACIFLFFLANPGISPEKEIRRIYGINLPPNVRLRYCYGMKIKFFLFVFFQCCFILNDKHMAIVWSRCIYCYAITRMLRYSGAIEIHQIPIRFGRFVFHVIRTFKGSKFIFISKSLRSLCNVGGDDQNSLVLADAAFKQEVYEQFYTSALNERSDDGVVRNIGYMGTLGKGRGFEIIKALAYQFKEHNFVCVGKVDGSFGVHEDLPSNLAVLAPVRFSKVHNTLKQFDILLMPYTNGITIGRHKVDTSSYMSPLKMFEYMASGIPFISSDLSPLKEVLRHDVNCLLASSTKVDEWIRALSLLISDDCRRRRLSARALEEVEQCYNWNQRSNKALSWLTSNI